MEKADFYIGQGPEANWIGSVTYDGYPESIPLEILICTNPTLFEELVVEFIESKNGIVKTNGQRWPWLWQDSRMTDFSYFFDSTWNDVVMSSYQGSELFDPIKFIQEGSISEANLGFGIPHFPKMIKGDKKWTELFLDSIRIMESIPITEISPLI